MEVVVVKEVYKEQEEIYYNCVESVVKVDQGSRSIL